jgi:predicted Fe-S protein YdhL (DUF1289 family)
MSVSPRSTFDPVATISPCVKVCRYDGGEYCLGCRRDKTEISAWFSLSNEQANKIMEELVHRSIPEPNA